MKLNFRAVTDVGRERAANEDSYTLDEIQKFAMVADGMGGQAAGEVASAMAVEKVLEFLRESTTESDATWPVSYEHALSFAQNRLRAAFFLANSAIFAESLKGEEMKGMGTTGVAALIEDTTAHIAHVGDSRAYLLRGGNLIQITRDHTWVNHQLESGLISEEEARNHPYKNIITRALGSSNTLEIDHIDQDLEKGDLMLLCTDGLTNMLSDKDIQNILILAEYDLDLMNETLLTMANDNGGKDNITVVLIHVESA
jgi:serine/threonine protein phosphatase PrpC